MAFHWPSTDLPCPSTADTASRRPAPTCNTSPRCDELRPISTRAPQRFTAPSTSPSTAPFHRPPCHRPLPQPLPQPLAPPLPLPLATAPCPLPQTLAPPLPLPFATALLMHRAERILHAGLRLHRPLGAARRSARAPVHRTFHALPLAFRRPSTAFHRRHALRCTAHAAGAAASAVVPDAATDSAVGQIWRDRVAPPIQAASARAAAAVSRSGVVDTLAHGGRALVAAADTAVVARRLMYSSVRQVRAPTISHDLIDLP